MAKTVSSIQIKSSHIKEAISAKDERVETALIQIGMLAEGYAKQALTDQNAVDTGRLRNSVTNQYDDSTVYVGTNVEYAPYIEFGTYRMEARPYLAPALEEHVDEYEKIIEDALRS